MLKNQWVVIAICLAGFLEAILYGFTFPYFSLVLEERGLSSTMIGLNATFGAVAVLIIGPFVPSLIMRFGYRLFACICFLVSAAALTVLLATENVAIWFGVRLILGFAFGSLWIVTEAWLNHVITDERRGRMNALFQMIYSIGFLSGPGLTHVVGFAGSLPILSLISVSLLGLIFSIMTPRETGAAADEHAGLNWAAAWRARGLVAVAALGGLVETALYTLLPLFGMARGLDEASAVNMLVAFSIGAITIALPLGWAADRLNRKALLGRCAVAATVSAFLLVPFGGDLWLAWALCFIAGGAIIGLYNLSLIVLGETYTGSVLPVVAAAFSMGYAVGCAGGAALGGIAMDLAGPNGLPFVVGGLLLAYVLASIVGKVSRPAIEAADAR